MGQARQKQTGRLLIAAVFPVALALSPDTAHGAPEPTFLYLNPGTGSCGELWHGDEYTEYQPADPAFVPLWQKPPTDKPRCSAALALMDKAELNYRLKAAKTPVPDRNKDPCGLLALALKGGMPLQGKYRSVCDALGYSYIGKVPDKSITLMTPEPPEAKNSCGCSVVTQRACSSTDTPSLFALLIALFIGI